MTLRHIVDLVLAGAVLVVFIMVLATAGRLAVLAKQLEAKGKRLESLPLIARLEAAKADGERVSALPAQAAPIFARAQVAIQTLEPRDPTPRDPHRDDAGGIVDRTAFADRRPALEVAEEPPSKVRG